MRTVTEEFIERTIKEERAKAQEERKGTAKMIKAGMKKFNASFEQICDILEVPEKERSEYEKLIDLCEETAVQESRQTAADSSECDPVCRRSLVDQTADQLIEEKGRYYQLYTGNAIGE